MPRLREYVMFGQGGHGMSSQEGHDMSRHGDTRGPGIFRIKEHICFPPSNANVENSSYASASFECQKNAILFVRYWKVLSCSITHQTKKVNLSNSNLKQHHSHSHSVRIRHLHLDGRVNSQDYRC